MTGKAGGKGAVVSPLFHCVSMGCMGDTDSQ